MLEEAKTPKNAKIRRMAAETRSGFTTQCNIFRKTFRARYRMMGTTKALQGRVQKTEWAIKKQVFLISEGRGFSISKGEGENVECGVRKKEGK